MNLTLLFASIFVMSSPNDDISCSFDLPGGIPTVEVRLKGEYVGAMAVNVCNGAREVGTVKPVRSVSSSVKPIWGTASSYPENYRETEISLKNPSDGRTYDTVTIRAYNEGVAVRASHKTHLYGIASSDNEATSFRMADGTKAWCIPGTEATFPREAAMLKDLNPKAKYRMPFTMKLPGGAYASLIEANVRDYPRSNLRIQNGTITPVFAVGGRAGRGIVKTPWRALLLAPSAGGLIERAYLAELLNDPNAITDASWIKPGLCVSDQGNCELIQKDLVATAKAAKALGARYLQIDWGWYGTEVPWDDDDRAAYREGKYKDIAAANPGWEENTKADPFTIAKGHIPYHPTWPYGGRVGVDFDIKELVQELKALDMGLCLYVHGYVLENNDLEKLFSLYESWGLAGLKPGFVCYGSQHATEWLRGLAEISAKHHLWIDIHDAHIPDGFERTWPNVMITEGGGGQEGNHPVRQDVALPFTRCLIGPFDYTPMFFEPHRTHAHAAAMLLAYPGPTAIMRGKVSEAAADPVAPFVKSLPWNYDESRVLAGEVADHIVVARRKGNTWYIAGLAGDTPRKINIPLSFLGEGEYELTQWCDDMSDGTESKRATVSHSTKSAKNTLVIDMAIGGGYAAIIRKK